MLILQEEKNPRMEGWEERESKEGKEKVKQINKQVKKQNKKTKISVKDIKRER
jgi:hypothetical protein